MIAWGTFNIHVRLDNINEVSVNLTEISIEFLERKREDFMVAEFSANKDSVI